MQNWETYTEYGTTASPNVTHILDRYANMIFPIKGQLDMSILFDYTVSQLFIILCYCCIRDSYYLFAKIHLSFKFIKSLISTEIRFLRLRITITRGCMSLIKQAEKTSKPQVFIKYSSVKQSPVVFLYQKQLKSRLFY